ncbi:hypothetical protein ZEAMMB73_Zm00001d048652 [Zea mays]|uniref:Uncharacterized protein n=1 Tax=Zea mays TaxID=4577 RepID=A0A1D6PN98_MAIZE|nr:hypothetical protein ZEAMMB73_Zm00001d048652 [Zea mays]
MTLVKPLGCYSFVFYSGMTKAPPDDSPHPPLAEAGAATPSRSIPSGFKQLDGRVKELTSSQAE